MKASTKQLIIKLITESSTGLSTTNLSKKLNLSRSATSLYLNELAKNNLITKQNTYPVLWTTKETISTDYTDVFKRFIGSNGSAKKTIDLCKAAVSYPPRGLPILLHGNSGVGKTFLAHLIYEYLHVQKAPCSSKLIVFNCADYANNPELLSSILFGYKKGAYTGADGDKKGLLAQSDNGMLFLDEVHRLSFENQEKLFQFMDSGMYRVIGEEDKVERANVRMIFATTEDPKKVLLPTFFRRISSVLELSDYDLRPLGEREILLKTLFQKESNLLQRKISINPEIFRDLLEYKSKGNIGQLENRVKIYCADALHSESSLTNLSIGEKSTQPVIVSFDQPISTQSHFDYQALNILTEKIKASDDPKHLKNLLLDFVLSNSNNHSTITKSFIFSEITRKLAAQTTSILGTPQILEGLSDTITFYLTLNSFWADKKIFDPYYRQLQVSFPRTFLLAKKITRNIDHEFRDKLQFLLAVLLLDTVTENISYHALLVAHGNSTASSIQSVANQLCGDYVFDAIDMPLKSSVEDIVQKVKNWLSERDTSKGVIMLVDMGSLTHLYKGLKPEILGKLLVVNNLTTSFALEIGQQLLNHNLFHEITKSIEKDFVTDIQYFEGFSNDRNIIISSILGYGFSQKLQEIFEKVINPEIKIIVMNFNELMTLLDREKNDKGYLNTTELIITTSYLENKTDVPSVNLLDFLDDDFTQNKMAYLFSRIVNKKQLPELMNNCIMFFSQKGLSEKLEFLNPEIILKQVEKIIANFERRFNIKFNVKIKYNLTMHLALMIEHTILGSADYPLPENLNDLKINDIYFYSNAKNLLYPIETFYNITISDWELYVLYEIVAEQ